MKKRRAVLAFPAGACVASCAWAAESLPLSTNPVPSPEAAQAILEQTARGETLRLMGLDLFPHAGARVTYDDNLFISHIGRENDVVCSLTPGLMLATGDVSQSLPGPVTLEQLRNLLYYSLADEATKPRRFLGVDYTPSINFYTEHNDLNNVDQLARLSAGYNFSRLTIGLDFDFTRAQVKDNSVGNLVTIAQYDARLRTRYDFTDVTSLEVDGEYFRFNYADPRFQGYQDFRNEDWLNRQFGEKLSAGLGAAFGYLEPENSPEQTYEQALVRAVYRLTGKSYLSASAGVEVRQFRTGAPDAVTPVFRVAGIYQPWVNTTFTLEAYRLQDPAPFNNLNYIELGAGAGVRQLLLNRWYAGLTAGYDNVQYNQIQQTQATVRTDNYWFAQLNLDYEFNPHWTATLFYTFSSDDSDVPTFSYYNDLVGARITWRY